MKIATLIIFSIMCLGFGLVFTLFCKTKGYKGLLIRGALILSAFIFAVVSANLNLINSALSLFIYIGLALILFTQALQMCEIDEEKPRMWTFGILQTLSISMFAVAAITMTGFNVFALGGGLLLGLGLGCIICAVKKYKKGHQVLTTLGTCASLGLLLVEGVFACINSVRLISSIMMTAVGVCMLISHLISFKQRQGVLQYVSHALYAIGVTLLPLLIYFY